MNFVFTLSIESIISFVIFCLVIIISIIIGIYKSYKEKRCEKCKSKNIEKEFQTDVFGKKAYKCICKDCKHLYFIFLD